MIRKTLLVISLVLLVGTVGLWVRSYWAAGDVHVLCRPSVAIRAVCQEGWLYVGFLLRKDALVQPAYLRFSVDGKLSATRPSSGSFGLAILIDDPLPDGFHRLPPHTGIRCSPTAGPKTPASTSWLRAAGRTLSLKLGKVTVAHFPLWIPVLVFLVVPAISAGRLVRHRYRRRHNLCVKCGYSLEGNVSGTCPECGTVVAGSTTEVA